MDDDCLDKLDTQEVFGTCTAEIMCLKMYVKILVDKKVCKNTYNIV